MNKRLALAAFLTTFVASCNGSSDSEGGPGSSNGLTTSSLNGLALDADGIVDLDPTVDERFRAVFGRYTAVEVGPGRVHVLAQAGVPDAKVRRVSEVLRQHLTDLAGGGSKADVAQAMVDRGALLGIFTDLAAADEDRPEVAAVTTDLIASFVPLAATHVVLEGSPEYMQAAPALDLTFGATALLVHRAGLRVARPGYADQLDGLAAAAIASGEFAPAPGTPASDEAAAFLAMAMDVHAGVHGHDPHGDGSARAGGAVYAYGSRAALRAGAPAVSGWIEAFFGADHTFQVELPEDFTGRFDGLRRASTPYTARSQHLRTIRLTGSEQAEIFAPPFGCRLEGNAGNNNIKGRAGDDLLVGGGGFDTAVFNGPMADYEITFLGDGSVIVDDVLGGHEGTDTVIDIDRLQFSDQGLNL